MIDRTWPYLTLLKKSDHDDDEAIFKSSHLSGKCAQRPIDKPTMTLDCNRLKNLKLLLPGGSTSVLELYIWSTICIPEQNQCDRNADELGGELKRIGKVIRTTSIELQYTHMRIGCSGNRQSFQTVYSESRRLSIIWVQQETLSPHDIS